MEDKFEIKFKSLKRIHDSTNEAVEQLHKEVAEKNNEIERLRAINNTANEAAINQKVLAAKYIADAEAYKRSLEQEIIELKQRLKG